MADLEYGIHTNVAGTVQVRPERAAQLGMVGLREVARLQRGTLMVRGPGGEWREADTEEENRG